MDHVVYLDKKSNEYELLCSGKKTMLVRGAMGRKMPHGRVNVGDILFFINNNGEGKIIGKAKVCHVLNSEKMIEMESIMLLDSLQEKLQLSEKQKARWGGKRYLVLIEIKNFEALEPFEVDFSSCKNMDDWLLVEDIKSIIA